jgi:MoaA/NifB/PqqE/SkfB family radical SAM enzyme
VVFSGAGDPLTHPDICSFIRAAIDLGIKPYCFTDAQECSPAQARALYSSGLRGILVSLHGPDAESHEAATCCVGSFLRTVRGLQALQDAGLRVQTNTVITIFNLGSLDRLVDRLVEELGVDEVAFSYPRIEGNALKRTECIPAYEMVASPLRAELARLVAMGKPVTVENLPICYVPPNEYRPMPDYPVLYKDIDFDLTVRPSEVDMHHPPACDGCRLRQECAGIDELYPHPFLPGACRVDM